MLVNATTICDVVYICSVWSIQLNHIQFNYINTAAAHSAHDMLCSLTVNAARKRHPKNAYNSVCRQEEAS